MTDNEIIKALKSCGNHLDCVYCECVDNCPQDINELNGLTFDLINRLQAQNKDLAETVHNLTIEKDALFDKAEELKAEIEKSKTNLIKFSAILMKMKDFALNVIRLRKVKRKQA